MPLPPYQRTRGTRDTRDTRDTSRGTSPPSATRANNQLKQGNAGAGPHRTALRSLTTSDGFTLVYDVTWRNADVPNVDIPPVVLLHGWSGSRRSYDECLPHLVSRLRPGRAVIRLDYRFHGDSALSRSTASPAPRRLPSSACTVPRLALDFAELLEHENLRGVTAVGASMGCAVLWCYFANHGKRVGKCVFVDQAPLQNRVPGWTLGSKGCYDDATLQRLMKTVVNDLGAVADGNAATCLANPIPRSVAAILKHETKRCNPPRALALLMADHTKRDWRPLLHFVDVPCLNVVGAKSGVFPVAGCLYVGDHVPKAVNVVFPTASHFLYIEFPAEFGALVAQFVESRAQQ